MKEKANKLTLANQHVIVEVESAVGITNLVKYWQCLEQNLIKKPIRLLHIFRQQSANDYASHLQLWNFVSQRMREALGDRFAAEIFTYDGDDLESELLKAVRIFESWIK